MNTAAGKIEAGERLCYQPLGVGGVVLVIPRRHTDGRGHFCETYQVSDFAAIGITARFTQDNQSLSIEPGTLRGLHFQLPPFSQNKLVRVIKGRVLDVVVDLRRCSADFGRPISVPLSAESGEQLYVPAGFAHGFCTLEPNTEIFYKVDAAYAPAHDRGLNPFDRELGISWPVTREQAVMSDKDRLWPRLSELPPYFN